MLTEGAELIKEKNAPDKIILMGSYFLNVSYIPFQEDNIIIGTVFKLRKRLRKIIRNSDLTPILGSPKYVKFNRTDETISI